jgi:uncharacterized phage protein (TIGR01671 family)
MREILFRGKRIDTGEWIAGQLIRYNDGRARIAETGEKIFCYEMDTSIIQTVAHHVATETVGQYTRLTDKNGKKIFEGDIIKIPDDYNEFGHNAGEIYEVYFCCGGFRLKPKYTKARGYWLEDDETVEVIGNIHDNPELLEVSHETD